MKKLYIFVSLVLLVSWLFVGCLYYGMQTPKPIETITLPAFEIEHNGSQVIKMGWEND